MTHFFTRSSAGPSSAALRPAVHAACDAGYLDSVQRLGTPTESRAVQAFVAAPVPWRPSPLRFARHPASQAAVALRRIADHQFPLNVTETARLFFERSALVETGQVAADMRAVAASPPDTSAAARLSIQPFCNARLRTTCVATRVDAGHADNALPQTAGTA